LASSASSPDEFHGNSSVDEAEAKPWALASSASSLGESCFDKGLVPRGSLPLHLKPLFLNLGYFIYFFFFIPPLVGSKIEVLSSEAFLLATPDSLVLCNTTVTQTSCSGLVSFQFGPITALDSGLDAYWIGTTSGTRQGEGRAKRGGGRGGRVIFLIYVLFVSIINSILL
jgi:hypothetical protein